MQARFWSHCGQTGHSEYLPQCASSCPLLRREWKGQNVLAAFPFSLRSAPKIFNVLADAFSWIPSCLLVSGFSVHG